MGCTYACALQGKEDAASAEQRFYAMLSDLNDPPILPTSSWPLVKPQVSDMHCAPMGGTRNTYLKLLLRLVMQECVAIQGRLLL